MDQKFTAKSLVPILAETLEVPQATALVIDRVLAEADFRAKGKGRNWPEMLRREAIVFILACMTLRKPTHAAKDVAPWLSAKCDVVPPKEPDASDQFEWRSDDDYEQQLQLFSSALKLLPHKDKRNVSLVDWILVVCGLLEAGEIDVETVQVELTLTHWTAAIEFTYGLIEPIGQVFVVEREDGAPKLTKTSIVTKSSISGFALQEVIRRTKGEAHQKNVKGSVLC